MIVLDAIRHFIGAVRPGPVGAVGRAASTRRVAGQRGFSTLALALIGLLVGSSLAVPALQLAGGTLVSSVGPAEAAGARAAAEHALWRLQYDPTVHAEMTGSPPSIDYVLQFANGDANVNITASSDPPSNSGLRSSIVVSPTVIEPDTPTEVAFTLTLINDDVVDHEVTRFRAIPLLFWPSYISGSTTGATTQNPSLFFGIYTWELGTNVVVPAFGGSTSISWRMTFDQSEGQYWTEGVVRVEGEGNVWTPLDAYVRAVVIGDLTTNTVVTPNDVVAGTPQTFTYTITYTNNGTTTYEVEWLKHFVPQYLNHVSGSTTGATTVDPTRTTDFINSRWVYKWAPPSVFIPAGGQITLQFDVTGAPLPGTTFASSSIRVEEDEEASFIEPTSATGETAPIRAVRTYTITAIQNGETVTVIVSISNAGIDILSWIES